MKLSGCVNCNLSIDGGSYIVSLFFKVILQQFEDGFFVIDDKRTIRALVYYPMNVGRNVEEVLRLVTALQITDQHACATPVDWRPGQKVVVPPPKIVPEVRERLSHRGKDYDVKDFYLSFRDGPPN